MNNDKTVGGMCTSRRGINVWWEQIRMKNVGLIGIIVDCWFLQDINMRGYQVQNSDEDR